MPKVTGWLTYSSSCLARGAGTVSRGTLDVDLQGAVVLHQHALQEIQRRAADETGHELVLRLVVHLHGRSHLLDEAVAHDDDAVAHGHGLHLVVGDVDHGGVKPLVQLDQLGAHVHAQLGVQVAERLVEQENLRVAHDGAAHGDALALAARQLFRLAVEELADTQDIRRRLHPLVDLGPRRAAQLQGERHVLEHGHVGIERVVLEHHGDVAILRRHVVHQPLADANLARRNVLQTGNHPQGRRLAAPRGTDQHDEFLVLNVEIHAVDGNHLFRKLLDKILQDDLCH